MQEGDLIAEYPIICYPGLPQLAEDLEHDIIHSCQLGTVQKLLCQDVKPALLHDPKEDVDRFRAERLHPRGLDIQAAVAERPEIHLLEENVTVSPSTGLAPAVTVAVAVLVETPFATIESGFIVTVTVTPEVGQVFWAV